MKINICTGYPLSSPKGNSVTAKRLTNVLRDLGHDATAMHTDSPPAADVQFSLHALNTATATKHFVRENPSGRIFVMLTGTDLYGGLETERVLSAEIFDLATRLIVAHPACISDIPARYRDKVVVIYPSLELPPPVTVEPPSHPLFTNVGHLRAIKNPHLMFAALQELPPAAAAYSIGAALDNADGNTATKNMNADSRYRWLADCDRATALGWMQNSVATINTSFAEGGANTIIEAIHLKVPVLASDIAGNRGFLGDDYDGYFQSDNRLQLASLMQRCLNDAQFRQHLLTQLKQRESLFTQKQEAASLAALLNDVKKKGGHSGF